MRTPKNESMLVTPEMAEGWLNHNLYGRQRRRAQWQVDRLAAEMENGRFIAGTQIHFGVIDGHMKLVNGQHTLAAIVKSGLPQVLAVLSTTVDSEAELGQLYGRHDRHRGRTPHDAFMGMGLAAELRLEEPEVNAFGSALKFVLMGFRRPSVVVNAEIAMSIDYLADEMRQWAPSAGAYFDAVRDARYGMKGAFRRSPVVAVGLVTFQYQKDKAEEFWGGASKDDGLHRLDPRRALNQFLGSTTSRVGDPITYMRCIASAWNKHFDQGELQFIRPTDSGKVGITIRGTPFKSTVRKGRGPANMGDPDRGNAAPVQGELGEVTGQ